jgi:hypothetical protein
MYVKILLYLIFLLKGDRVGGKGVCGRLMSPAHETQTMREIRLLRGRLKVLNEMKLSTFSDASSFRNIILDCFYGAYLWFIKAL